MLTDLRSAFRQLVRAPLHTVTVVLILAIGIGANTAIFSLVRSVILKPLPYPESERLVFLQQQQNIGLSPFSWPNFQDLKHDNRSFESLAVYNRNTFTVTGRGPAEQSGGAAASADFFRVLGVAPILGRVYTETEDSASGPKVVVLRESFWRRKLGGDPTVLGQILKINSQPYEIIGVLPNAVGNPSGVEFWIPITPLSTNNGWQNRRNQPGLFAFGRLKPGVTLEQAKSDVLAIGQRLQRDYPADNSGILPVVQPLMSVLVGSYRDSLFLLLAAVGLLLVIACANIASLQVARSLGRVQEFSIRAALGSGRQRLVRQVLVESTVLSLIGGGLGVLFAYWSIDALKTLLPITPRFQGLAIDNQVLAFSFTMAVATGLVFGLWPAIRAARTDLREALQASGNKGAAGATSQRMRQGMVTLQVALTVMLLASAGLFGRSLQRIARFEYGFDSSNLLLVAASVPDTPGNYDNDEKRIAFFNSVRDRVAQLPGVRSVGLNYSAPLRMDWSQMFDVDGRPEFPAGKEPVMGMGVIDTNYFATLGLPLIRGRNFDATDKLGGPTSIIIDQRMAEKFWPGEDPIGKVILRGNRRNPIEKRRAIVVGVVPSVEVEGFAEGPRLYQAYLAQSQIGNDEMNIVIRTNVDPRTLVDSIRTTMAAVDPNVPAYGIATMEELIARESSTQRLYVIVVSLFAGIALLLAALGLGGVVAHAVAARRREIGIRMALGALQRQVVSLVLRQGAAPLALGLVLGLGGAVVAGHLIAAQLYKISPCDPVAMVLAVATLTATGLFALWLPARRAAKVDPMIALRAE